MRDERWQLFSPGASHKGDLLVIPIFIPHSGCPHSCLFCNQIKISGAKESPRTAAEITGTIETWLKRSKPRRLVQVAFYGGSFTCLPEQEQIRLLSPVASYTKSGVVDTIRLSTRPDCISTPILELLREYGVGVVELGVQSLSDDVLLQNRRGHTAARAEESFRALRDAGFTTGIQLMSGLPGETRRSFLTGVSRVADWSPDLVRLYPALVVKGAGLERQFREQKFKPQSLHEAVALCARALELFEQAEVAVVRTGLQPSEELAASYVAGPYHPSFGEYVRSRIWFRHIRSRLARLRDSEFLEISVSHRDISAVVGLSNMNTQRLEELGFSGRYSVRSQKDMMRGTIHYAVSTSS